MRGKALYVKGLGTRWTLNGHLHSLGVLSPVVLETMPSLGVF